MNRIEWNSKTLRKKFGPICWLNWVLCLGVFEYPIGSPKPIFSLVYHVVFFGIYFNLFAMRWYILDLPWHQYEKLTYCALLYLNVAVGLSCVVLGWFNSKDVASVMDRCEQVDETLAALGARKGSSGTRDMIFYYVLWIVVAGIIPIMDFYFLVAEYNVLESIGIVALTYVPICLNSVVELTFMFYSKCLLNRVRKMNKTISEVIKGRGTKDFLVRKDGLHRPGRMAFTIVHDTKRNYLRYVLVTIKQVHLEIVQISRQLNKAFCLQILFQTGMQVSLTTMSLYNIYLSIVQTKVMEEEANKMSPMFLWLGVSTVKGFWINAICDSAYNEAQRTGQIIQELQFNHSDWDLREEIEQFTMQVILHPLRFSACGFVVLNNQFTRLFLATVVTHLVILIQMGAAPSVIKSLVKIT